MRRSNVIGACLKPARPEKNAPQQCHRRLRVIQEFHRRSESDIKIL